jgi:hypothetical protein
MFGEIIGMQKEEFVMFGEIIGMQKEEFEQGEI